jgi:hypothetical protein
MEQQYLVDPHVRAAVLAVLRKAKFGFIDVVHCQHAMTGLSWWQRVANRVARWIGADTPPFTHPGNCTQYRHVPLADVASPDLINRAMIDLAPDPICRLCGGSNWDPDPAGYFCDAVEYNGAPLLCLDCRK